MSAGGTHTLRTTALTVGAGASLDLNDNPMILDYAAVADQAAAVRASISSARSGGTWQGMGLTSTSAKTAAGTGGHTTLGFMQVSEYKTIYGTTATFAGEAIDDSAVLIKYTTDGDATFDGNTDFNDFLALQNNFGNTSTTFAGGNFDYNDVTDFNDFLLMQNAFGATVPATVPPAKATATLGSISGVVFNDSNRNGKYERGDSSAAGKMVWLDLDDDGVKDTTEPSAVTDVKGRYVFKNLSAGTYHVRRVFPRG